MPTARILVPGAYLDAYLADPPATAPAELHDLLAAAQPTGEGPARHAALDLPAHLLAALAVITDAHFFAWGERATYGAATTEERHTLNAAARAAFLTNRQTTRRLNTAQERTA